MSLGAKIVVSAMRGIKKTGLIKGPGPDLDAELRKARDYNRKHPYQEPTDRKAAYQTIQVGQHPCLVIRPENQAGKAILYLHGGGNHDARKPEVAFARAYGKRAGMLTFHCFCRKSSIIDRRAYSHAILVGSPFFGDVLCKKNEVFQ